jgi:AraC-like DNA-binding protein
MLSASPNVILQETLWGPTLGGALWPFQPRGWEYIRPVHLHGQPELFIMRQGSLRLRVGGESFRMGRGMLAWIAPSVEHVTDELSENADFWILQLEPWLVDCSLAKFDRGYEHAQDRRHWLRRLIEFIPDPPLLMPTRGDFERLEYCAEQAWQCYLSAWANQAAPDPRFEWIPPWTKSTALQARALLSDVFVEALRITQIEKLRSTTRRLAREAFDVLLRDPELSRLQLCDRLNVSEGHLSRRFPDVFGANLVEQRARLRLVTFLGYVKSKANANMLSACLNAGFGSYAQLHRVFSAHSAYGPREYLYGEGQLCAAKITSAELIGKHVRASGPAQ